MHSIPPQRSRTSRDWIITLPFACVLLLGAIFLLLLPAGSQGEAYAAGATVTPVSDPFIVITSPTPNAVLSTSQAPILITAVANGGSSLTISQVSFNVDGTQIGISTSAPYSASWMTLTPGTHSLQATAIFTSGGTLSSPSVPVTVQVGGLPTPTQTPCVCGTPTPQPPPTVAITNPANGATFTAPATVVITATASAHGEPVGRVDFYNGTTLLGTATTAPYSFTWTNVAAGTYTLTATATGANVGDKGTSAPVTITVSPAAAACQVHYQVASQWLRGFSVNLTISNTGSTTFNGWTLQLTFPGDQRITQIWNGSVTQSGEQVTITNLPYDATLPPGSSTSLGFNGSWIRDNTSPTSFTLNGVSCTTT
jgi:hypothetical protein